MARPYNFKGQIVLQGGACRKFALWLKPWLETLVKDIHFQQKGCRAIKLRWF